MKPSKLIDFLKTNNKILKKSLSQNFLVDENIINKIVQTAQVTSEDFVLEIGPGAGSLTAALLKKTEHMTVVEKDTFFANHLSSFFENLAVYNQDILSFDLKTIKSKTKVIANLPYNITTPTLIYLLEKGSLFSSHTLMVQKEVAERICAKPNTKTIGSLSIFVQFYTEPTYAFTVSKNCFMPRPKVDSAVIYLKTKTPPLQDPSGFFKMVRTSFGQRRKMLTTSLRELYPKQTLLQALTKTDLSPTARPENLSLQDWLLLYKYLMHIEN